ncbi:hypothetical protein [Pseudonocardia acaciae]|uniref:hypothetical protein n=1 Tax=Pseudonocardia acaciae TaxID=551276 RepID=UPI00068513B1|nr:hypothetical protein [Pseudonocardia acaciae]
MNSNGVHADWSAWPLVVIDASAVPVSRAPRLTLDVLGAALERGGDFAVVARLPTAAESGRGRQSPTERLALIREVKAIRPGLVERCRALVFVLSGEERQKHRAKLASSGKFWGCPVEVAEVLADARALAGARLSAD